jgi:hypothetical protein
MRLLIERCFYVEVAVKLILRLEDQVLLVFIGIVNVGIGKDLDFANSFGIGSAVNDRKASFAQLLSEWVLAERAPDSLTLEFHSFP